MQKDFHFYITYCLAKMIGISKRDAELVAWANQFTDDCRRPELYGIQTQSAILDTWMDRQVQLSVIVPFHFIPGASWIVEAGSERVKGVLAQASNSLELGIALHTAQDSYSHQGFTGWQEEANSCYPWYYLKSVAPNVGHAEMGVIPDVTHYTWTDPRTNERVDNAQRALAAARTTFEAMVGFFEKPKSITNGWSSLAGMLESIFKHDNYDKRKQILRELSGDPGIRYSELDMAKYHEGFSEAATKHLSRAMIALEGLPR